MTPKPTTAERDSAQLEALGYDSKFDRSMSLWANFALGFTYLSPVVGVYTVFAFAIATGGPPMFWSYLFVGLGQLLVALVFGEIVSQFPIAGGLYPWARRLVGKHGHPRRAGQPVPCAAERPVGTVNPNPLTRKREAAKGRGGCPSREIRYFFRSSGVPTAGICGLAKPGRVVG